MDGVDQWESGVIIPGVIAAMCIAAVVDGWQLPWLSFEFGLSFFLSLKDCFMSCSRAYFQVQRTPIFLLNRFGTESIVPSLVSQASS